MAVNVSVTEKGMSFEDMKRYTEQLAGKELNAGVLRNAGREKKTGADLVDIAMWNEYGTSNGHIPKRPFMRIAENKNGKKWGKLAEDIASKVIDGSMGVDQGMELVGNQVVGDIQEVIGNRNLLTPNAQSTINQKGSDAPLIDTGQLRQAISFEVR